MQTSRKPRIGIMPINFEKMGFVVVREHFLRAVIDCGAVPIMLPRTGNKDTLDEFVELCDGMILSGGHDVNPELYGEEKADNPEFYDDVRDVMEGHIVDAFMKTKKPIFAICRGMQFMNVHFGGTLYTDINKEYKTNIDHPRDHGFHGIAHNVTVLQGTPLYDIISRTEYGVNSFHHQAIKEMASVFRVCAVSEDGLIEGVYIPGEPVIGVQWHPELMIDDDAESRKLFNAFIDACQNNMKKGGTHHECI